MSDRVLVVGWLVFAVAASEAGAIVSDFGASPPGLAHAASSRAAGNAAERVSVFMVASSGVRQHATRVALELAYLVVRKAP